VNHQYQQIKWLNKIPEYIRFNKIHNCCQF
jgi:hypothetical protein